MALRKRSTKKDAPEQQQDQKEAQPGRRKKKFQIKKKHIKWYVIGAVVLAIAIWFITCTNRIREVAASMTANTDFTVLAYSDLKNSISATGTVESADKTNVYTTMTYPVKAIHVEVGDVVQAGDVLLELDRDVIQKQIHEKELSIETSEKAGELSVRTARDTYNSFKEGLDNGTNPNLISALTAVDNAQDKYDAAVKTHDEYVDQLNKGEVEALLKAEQTYYNALAARDKASNELKAFPPAATPSEKTKLEVALQNAEDVLETADAAYRSAYRNVQSAKEDYLKAVETAKRDYETALASLEAAQKSAQDQLQGYKNSLESARVSAGGDLADYQLEELKNDLEKASVTAPVAGTVTAVYATEGATSSGLLFIIEDTGELIVKTNVKEYDIGTVQEGIAVSIKSDATGDAVFDGKIKRIAPAANKNAQGNTDTTGDILFDTEVAVTSQDTPLRIGMSVRLEFIIDEEDQVLSVPYEAVYQNADGQDCVLGAYPQEDGQFLLTELPVTTGMENDLSIAISGDGIEPGLTVLSTPGNYAPGQTITIYDASTLQGASGAAGAAGGGGPAFGMRIG